MLFLAGNMNFNLPASIGREVFVEVILMTNELFNSYSIKKFPEESNDIFDEGIIVYHYTSPEAFLSIITNEYIRFSDARYMNDKSEGKFFIKALLEFLEKNKNVYPLFEEAAYLLLKQNDLNMLKELEITNIDYYDPPKLKYKTQRQFLFCTCTSPDLLNMWNYYVNNGNYQGYNIGLKLSKILKTFDTDNQKELNSFSVYYGEVIYSAKEQEKEIKKLAEEIEKKYKNDRIEYAVLKIRAYAESQGLFYKSNKFSGEKEYRILVCMSDDNVPRLKSDAQKYFGKNNKELSEGFCTKNGLIVPFLNVKLPFESISRITTSPITEYNIAKEGIKEVLKTKGQSSIPVYKSTIPIRF